MRWLLLLLIVLGVPAGWMLFAPTTLAPVVWQPDPPRQDLLTGNERLSPLHRVELGADAHGPEDVALDATGRAFVGLLDGRILRVDPDNGKYRMLANTGGRPLGLDFDADGQLLVADAARGLLSIDPERGEIRTLATEAAGVPFRLTDDVEVGPDGMVYFSDASAQFPFDQYQLDILEGAGSGRLLQYDPVTGSVRVLMDGLMFANGVAVGADGAYVLVVETGRYRVWRYWLRGAQAGQKDVLIDGLPGFPDGISRGSNGIFWIPLASPRSVLIDLLAGQPLVRKMISRLPPQLFPGPKRWAYVLGVDGSGAVVHNFQQPDGYPLAFLTSVQEFDGYLYLGSLHESAFGIFRLPE